MVRVLSTGEVVSDDDPRARQRPSAPRPQPSTPTDRQPQAQGGQMDGFGSLWNNANDRLRQFGLNSFYIAGYRVDPLHIVIAVLGFILSGPMMLALVVAAIVISQSSSDNSAPAPARQNAGMLARRGALLLGKAAPCCSTSVPLRTRRSPQEIASQRHQSTLPPAIGNLFLYASDCYITQGLQFGMESLHGLGMSWPAVFIASGLALRVASSPLHILAEKL
ncbi:hypothetical protein OESDEN_08508 [Oesophagostomum dentatum]|uniref:DUF4605 domain-containing protein n=1 Tax=Oesophagostomum dentatum TaxID=61180 RepID=A0A0B1T340_OESDE|nr:hypothetical protein OESDEN_08508 [Oesophagostomum dentatum]